MGKSKGVFFTVIVPAYNCEKTINRLLDSIRQQDMNDFKVIICDDSDHEGLHEYVRPYKTDRDIEYYLREKEPYRIHCPGNTRHSALKRALQEDTQYILFVDSDDCFVPNTFKTLKDMIVNGGYPEMVGTRFDVHDDSGRFLYKEHISLGWLHGKAYRADFLRDNGIQFGLNQASHEDTYFNSLCAYYIMLKNLRSAQSNDFQFYIWHKRPESTSHKQFDEANEIGIQKLYRDYLAACVGVFLTRFKEDGITDPDQKLRFAFKVAHDIHIAYCYFQGFVDKGNREYLVDAYQALKDTVWNYCQTFGVTTQDLIKVIYSEPAISLKDKQISHAAVGEYIEHESFMDFINRMRFYE